MAFSEGKKERERDKSKVLIYSLVTKSKIGIMNML
jgi:hypothetical protein